VCFCGAAIGVGLFDVLNAGCSERVERWLGGAFGLGGTCGKPGVGAADGEPAEEDSGAEAGELSRGGGFGAAANGGARVGAGRWTGGHGGVVSW